MLRDPVQQPTQPVQPPHKHSPKKLVLFAVGGAVVALLLGGAVYWFALRDTETSQPEQANNTQNQQQTEQEDVPVADATPQTFKSEKLNIELTHRKDWTLTESADGAITITSPRISYAAQDGTSQTGVFTLRIRKGASDAQRATIDKSVATRDSEVIAYAAPVEGQRQYTNLSFVGPKDKFGFFIVTGNTEFKAGAPLMYSLPMDGSSYLIAGGYGADTTNSLSFDPVPKESMDSTTLERAIDIVESLKIY